MLGAPICWPIQEQSESLTFQAGVFSYNNQTLLEFCDMYRQAVDKLDVLITWFKNEKYLYIFWRGVKNGINRVNFGALELPFRFSSPWWL